MADASEADTESEATPKQGGSMVKSIAAMVLLTAIAAATGAGLAVQLVATIEASIKRRQEAEAAKGFPVVSRYASTAFLKELPPIITNVGSPADIWIRLEASVVFNEEAEDSDILAGQIAEDILAYVRTVSLAQIEGGSGLQHLTEDLGERAAIRSQGLVRDVVLQTLVVQ